MIMRQPYREDNGKFGRISGKGPGIPVAILCLSGYI
jgi:hypothetical protein